MLLYLHAPLISKLTGHGAFRRGGRAVDRAGLENRKAERPREFESHPLRFALDGLRSVRCSCACPPLSVHSLHPDCCLPSTFGVAILSGVNVSDYHGKLESDN
jgi:hypothetical protein